AFNIFKSKSQSEHQLILAGRFAWHTNAIELAIKNSPFTTDIHTPGYLSEDQAVQYMYAADAFVYPSLFEGFGVPVLEAMHADVPVITSNTSSLPEVAGKAALLVDPTSSEAIANAMFQIFTKAELKINLIKAARLQRAKFDWETTSKIIYAQLEKISNK
ncbi:MAG: glycosyltransferase, partial [Bacteroidota bacterium]